MYKPNVLEDFVVFEGIDGSGTSTQIEMLSNHEKYHDAYFSSEPNSFTPIGKLIREILSGKTKVRRFDVTMSYLFMADRSNHLWSIYRNCRNKRLSISDRYMFSNQAYQCSNWLERNRVRIAQAAFPLPRLMIFFRIDADTAIQRIESRDGQREIFEKREKLEKVIANYEEIIKEYNDMNTGMIIREIDATKSAEDVHKEIVSILNEYFISVNPNNYSIKNERK